jgi:excisionase family DNA binding protein
VKADDLRPSEAIRPKWYTIEQVAVMLGYGLTKTKYLVHSGQIRSVKDVRNRRILPEWVDDYIRNKVEEMTA